jgi:hypothetical protein
LLLLAEPHHTHLTAWPDIDRLGGTRLAQCDDSGRGERHFPSANRSCAGHVTIPAESYVRMLGKVVNAGR